MRIEIRGVHYDITDVTRTFLQEKLDKLEYASEHIVDLLVTLTKNKKDWTAEATLNFRFGVSAHVSETQENLHAAIEKLVDRLDAKVRKEKDKVQDKHK